MTLDGGYRVIPSEQAPWGSGYVVDEAITGGGGRALVVHAVVVWVWRMRQATWGAVKRPAPPMFEPTFYELVHGHPEPHPNCRCTMKAIR